MTICVSPYGACVEHRVTFMRTDDNMIIDLLWYTYVYTHTYINTDINYMYIRKTFK